MPNDLTIDLSQTAPRDYQRTIEAALNRAGRADVIDRIRARNPRDMVEVLIMLPDDVLVRFWRTDDEQAATRAD